MSMVVHTQMTRLVWVDYSSSKPKVETITAPLERNQIIELERRTLPTAIATNQSMAKSDVYGLNAGDYSKSTMTFNPGTGVTASSITLSTSSTPSDVLGKITVVGETIYQGMGTYAEVVGSVDTTNNGTGGSGLQINFDQSFNNGDFSADSAGSTTVTGWTVLNQQVQLGSSTIAGFVTPSDTTYPANNGVLGDADTFTGTFSTQVVADAGGDKSVQMQSNLNSANGYAVDTTRARISQ